MRSLDSWTHVYSSYDNRGRWGGRGSAECSAGIGSDITEKLYGDLTQKPMKLRQGNAKLSGTGEREGPASINQGGS